MNKDPNQEVPSVKLKGVGDSLWVTFDPALARERLETELDKIFGRLKHLAVNARVVLDPGELDGCDELVDQLGGYLKANFQVGSVSKPSPRRVLAEERIRQRDADNSWHNRQSDVLMLAGRVRSGQKVTARKHLVILGDVNPGAEVEAGGNIIVMGSLCGTAAAGQPSREDAMVIALDFRPTQVQIGPFLAAGLDTSPVQKPEFAHVENGTVVVEEYVKSNPFKKLPWPEVL